MNYIYHRVPEFDKQFSKLTKKNKARLPFPPRATPVHGASRQRAVKSKMYLSWSEFQESMIETGDGPVWMTIR
jgi:hypothetical protein